MHFSYRCFWGISLAAYFLALSSCVQTRAVDAGGDLTRDFSVTDSAFSTQASVIVPCEHCVGPNSPFTLESLSFPFDFDFAPGESPCSSNLSLNSVPLRPSSGWDLEPRLLEGSLTLNSSGHELIVSWFSACNSASAAGSAAQVFTLLVKEINGTRLVSPAVAGFTLSFKDNLPPQLLSYSPKPTSPVNIGETFNHLADADSNPIDTVDDEYTDLDQLQAELDFLESLIKDKKKALHNRIHSELTEELDRCEGFACRVRVLIAHLHDRLHRFVATLFVQTKTKPLKINYAPSSFHRDQVTTMISTDAKGQSSPSLPKEPEKCHCRDEKPKAPPTEEETEPNYDPGRFREAKPPSKYAIVFRIFSVITGVALIFTLVRCCWGSPRRRRDRAARREQRHRERAYRRQACKQRFWDRLLGRHRGKPGRRIADLEEKRGLVNGQEAVLEQAMQDEIRQLEIHEEIRELKSTRDAVDELIRAEEGRVGPRLDATRLPHASSSISYMPGFNAVPTRSIMIPRPTHSSGSDVSSPTDGSFSPVSRTTSLPSYRSKPPSYRERESSDEYSDGRSVTTDNESDGDGEWGSGSSVPDFSPRPSAETIRTFV